MSLCPKEKEEEQEEGKGKGWRTWGEEEKEGGNLCRTSTEL